MSIVVVDEYGRIRIPRRYLEGLKAKRFLVKKMGNNIVLVPIEEKDLTKYFDSVKIDVEPSKWKDYDELKKVLLSG